MTPKFLQCCIRQSHITCCILVNLFAQLQINGSSITDDWTRYPCDVLRVKEHALHRTGSAGLFEGNRIVGGQQQVSVLRIENRMHALCNKRTRHPEPSLRLCNTEIPVVNETKLQRIIFDSKLTFKLHITNLRK
jgi:hypothetical protein